MQIIELHHKYLAYFTDCFSNHFLFHKVCLAGVGFVDMFLALHVKYILLSLILFIMILLQALNESFRTFFNWGPSGLSSGEMLAIYCDNILKAGGNGKLTDEAVEKALEKVESPGSLKKLSTNWKC